MERKNKKQDAPLVAFEVFVRMRRMGFRQQAFVKILGVTKAAISLALNGDPHMTKLLGKINGELDTIDAQSRKRASAKLRSINNSRFERVHIQS